MFSCEPLINHFISPIDCPSAWFSSAIWMADLTWTFVGGCPASALGVAGCFCPRWGRSLLSELRLPCVDGDHLDSSVMSPDARSKSVMSTASSAISTPCSVTSMDCLATILYYSQCHRIWGHSYQRFQWGQCWPLQHSRIAEDVLLYC